MKMLLPKKIFKKCNRFFRQKTNTLLSLRMSQNALLSSPANMSWGFIFICRREGGGMTGGPPSSSPFVAQYWHLLIHAGAFIPSFILLTLKGKNRECFYCLLSSTLASYSVQKIQPPNAQNWNGFFYLTKSSSITWAKASIKVFSI